MSGRQTRYGPEEPSVSSRKNVVRLHVSGPQLMKFMILMRA